MPQITITKEGSRWWASFPFSYETKDIVKAAGFRFDGTRKAWWTDRAEIAAKVSGDAVEIAARLNADAEAKRAADAAAVEASRATKVAAEIPVPEGLAYLPYQKAGIAYAMDRHNVLVADSMGLGKTIQAIGVINADPTIETVLVICPASLKLNWQRELRKWLARRRGDNEIQIANGHVGGPITIINYEQVEKLRDGLRARVWDLIIIDECHYLKNPKAQRTIAVLGKWDRDPEKRVEPLQARRRVFLTGTPMVNRPIEFYTLAKALDPDGLGKNWKSYVTRYCAGVQTRYGWDVSGASHLDELQAKARAAFMVRRLKADVLKDLPPKRRQVIALPANGASGAVADEAAIFARHEEAITRLRAAAELAKAAGEGDYNAAVEALQAASGEAFAEMSKARHAVALAKVPYVVEHVREVLDDGRKVVIFCYHLDVVREIAKEFDSATLTGETKIEDRQAAVDRFQTDPNCRVFVGTIRAAGVGITLTSAAHVVFAELDWVPGNVSQAEDRCHRIGQEGSVLVQHIVLDGSIDARMAEVLVQKQAVLEAALDRGERLPDAARLEAPTAPPATAALTARQVAEEAAALAPERAARALEGLRRLAEMDGDRAMELNGVGFSKADSYIGHALVSLAVLTARQTVLAEKICHRYRRQLGEGW